MQASQETGVTLRIGGSGGRFNELVTPQAMPCRVTMATVMTDFETQLGELEKAVIELDRTLAPVMVPTAEDRERIEVKQDLPALVRAGVANVARLRMLREAISCMASRALIES